MSEFLTTGFNLHIMKEFLDSFKTDNYWMDSLITISAITLFNQKHNLYKFMNWKHLTERIRRFFTTEIEYRLSSVRKTNYDGSFNVCHENLCSVCYYENKLIEQNNNIDTRRIQYF